MGGGEKGGEERGREGGSGRESRNVFVKKCLMMKRIRCNFLCWLGNLGERVVMSVKNERLYDMYGYERGCNMLEEKEKENRNEEKESTNT